MNSIITKIRSDQARVDAEQHADFSAWTMLMGHIGAAGEASIDKAMRAHGGPLASLGIMSGLYASGFRDCLGRDICTQAANASGAEIIAATIRQAGLDAAVDEDHSLPNYVRVSIPTMHEMVSAFEREALAGYAAAIWDMERESETAEPEAEAAF